MIQGASCEGLYQKDLAGKERSQVAVRAECKRAEAMRCSAKSNFRASCGDVVSLIHFGRNPDTKSSFYRARQSSVRSNGVMRVPQSI